MRVEQDERSYAAIEAEFNRPMNLRDLDMSQFSFEAPRRARNSVDSSGMSSYTLNSTSANSRSMDTTNNSSIGHNSGSSQVDSSYVSVTAADIERANRIFRANNLELAPMTSGSSGDSFNTFSFTQMPPPRIPSRLTVNADGIIVGPPGRTPAPRVVSRDRLTLMNPLSPVGSERSQDSNHSDAGTVVRGNAEGSQ